MKTIRKNNIAKNISQFTLENLTTSRAYLIATGWQDIKVDKDFMNESIDQIIDLLGGHHNTKKAIRYTLNNTPVYGWYAQRIVFEPLINKWVYIAGQDYPSELRTIRKELTK